MYSSKADATAVSIPVARWFFSLNYYPHTYDKSCLTIHSIVYLISDNV